MKIEQFIIPGRTSSAEQGNQDRSFEVPPQTGAERAEKGMTRGRDESDLNVGYAAAPRRCIVASSVCVVFQQRQRNRREISPRTRAIFRRVIHEPPDGGWVGERGEGGQRALR